jgi:ketosteroid isomerase-like protein
VRPDEPAQPVNASDADRCGAVWVADGALMPPHHPPVQGRQAIVEYLRSLFSRSTVGLRFTSSHIHLAGDTALEDVTYTAVIGPRGDVSPIKDAGKALHAYRRQPDGSWKLSLDIWNSDQPAREGS